MQDKQDFITMLTSNCGQDSSLLQDRFELAFKEADQLFREPAFA